MESKRVGWVLVFALCMVGCRRATPAPTLMLAATATSLLPTATSEPTTTLIFTQEPLPALNPQQTLLQSEPLRDVLLFESMADVPLNVEGVWSDPEIRQRQLWALSVDGQSASRLATAWDGTTAWYFHLISPPEVLLIASAPFPWKSERIRQIPGEGFGFQSFGPWAAFFSGDQGCAYRFEMVNLVTEETRSLEEVGASEFSFLPNGQVLVTYGHHCEDPTFGIFDPETGGFQGLGYRGNIVWSSDGTAFAVEASTSYAGVGMAVWGYNWQTGRQFVSTGGALDLGPRWSPDDTFLFYNHRDLAYTGEYTVTLGATQIIRVDATSGETRTLADDSEYDYYFCVTFDWQSCEWRGDWVLIRRIPSHAGEYPSLEFYDPCVYYGTECPDSAELFALNWRTGELIPWDQAPLPTVTPSPVPTATPTLGPDLSRAPIYAQPSGAYAFYVGSDGHSLWMVPANGEPQLWVTGGENFIYIP